MGYYSYESLFCIERNMNMCIVKVYFIRSVYDWFFNEVIFIYILLKIIFVMLGYLKY